MPVNLKTDWKTIGRSGKTVDGREITEAMLKDAAELYDPETYKAVVWPEHFQYYKMGGVEALRLKNNAEGGLDLQAILSPNEYWLNANSYDQKTFTSMELTKLAKFDNRWYLTGLGATDNPASFGTTELRFNKSQDETFRGQPVEFELDAKPTEQGFFSKLFKPQTEEPTVDKTAFEALLNELKELKAAFAKTQAQKTDADADKDTATAQAEAFKALEDRLKALEESFSQKDKPETGLLTKLEDLENRFTEALKTAHPDTTKPPEQTGEDFKREDYL